jgi:hypothetical protein
MGRTQVQGKLLQFDATWTCQGRAVCLPWQRYVKGLLCKYGVTFGATVSDYNACVSLVKKRVKSVWHEDLTLITPLEKITLKRYVDWVNPTLVSRLSLKSCSPYLRFLPPSYGVELLLRVRLSCLPVHAHTVGFQQPDIERRSRSQVRAVTSVCPVCSTTDETLAHFLFECTGLQSLRSVMYQRICTVPDCGQRLNACHAITDSRQRVYRFVSDDYWGSAERLRCVLPFITQYLMDAWGLRLRCKYGSDRITESLLWVLLLPPLKWGAGPMAVVLWVAYIYI